MIVNGDVRGLEWIAATFLSQDQVATHEILTGVDQHADNQKRFGLPSRLIAKTFLFRLIYGGSAYAYSKDFNFRDVSTSVKFWQDVIDATYDKYKGLARWHKELMQTATRTGRLTIPSGRIFTFSPVHGEWPRTTILNYPVQGFGADLVMLARIAMYRRMIAQKSASLLISSVHDSIVLDSPANEWYNICKLLKQCIVDIPANVERCFKVKFNLPMTGEIFYGPNKKDMTLYAD